MKNLADQKWFERFLEILPGFSAWLFILIPFIFASSLPLYVAILILVFSFYWLVKALNISRHLIFGYQHLRWNMKINWLEYCKMTEDIEGLKNHLAKVYKAKKSRYAYEDLLLIENLEGNQSLVKDWKTVKNLVFVAMSTETYDILEPTIEALAQSSYPNDKILVVIAAEDKYKDQAKEILRKLESKYKDTFGLFRYYWHVKKDDEVVGKGPNLTSAAHFFWKEYGEKYLPEDLMVTNLDADHIVHKEYLARLTYAYVIDPSREIKSYQPVPLLFNNIWEAPYLNRIGAVSSSFWQIVESMRPYKLRTFAAHAQSMTILLKTDFWSTKTIVEDGHQYWRTYFVLNGSHYMVPIMLPIYQDAVIGETLFSALKGQYLQRRRWAWGVTDFPFIVINSLKHKEIPVFERVLQSFRHFSGLFSWSSASFFLAFAWVPLALNSHFQETVIAQNIAIYSSYMLRIAWVGIILNVWFSLLLIPKKPHTENLLFKAEMILMWFLSPIFAIFFSALPALESQTRLMLGKRLDVFWITPKIRKSKIEIKDEKEVVS